MMASVNWSVRRRAAEVARHRLAFADRRLERAADAPRALAVADVLEHHARGEHERARVGDALPRDVRRRAVHRLEDRAAESDVRARREPEPADEPGDLVGEDVAEQVRRDDDVEALGMQHEVHRHRVDDALLELDRPAYSRATMRPTSRKSPCENLRMFALWTSVTFLRPCFTA